MKQSINSVEIEIEIGPYANLSNADLSNAYLSGADLNGANLSNADLRNANLSNADLGAFKVCRMDFGGWSILVLPETTSIGCQSHPNSEWLRFTPEDVKDFAGGAFEYWTQHRESICAVIRDVMGK